MKDIATIADTIVTSNNIVTDTVTSATTHKIFLLRILDEYFLKIGMTAGWADTITFIVACLLLAGIIWLLERIGSHLISSVINVIVKRTVTIWDDFLHTRNFFRQLFRIIAGMIILGLAKLIFAGYGPAILKIADIIINIYIILMILAAISTFLDVTNDVYETKPQSKRKSIKGYLQIAKITIYIIGGILIIAKIWDKNPTDLFLGLGAAGAVFTLIFKDTILGVVASFQISSQDMLRPGDWIEMKSKNADGIVTDINVSVVKVQNWDNTTTMIPIYSLVTESFTNWRYMQESGGRRLQRPLLIDIKSIDKLSDDQIEGITHNSEIAPLADEMMALFNSWNRSHFATNLGLYRCYIETYLKHHPDIIESQSITVKYKQVNEDGIAIEMYAFSSETDFTAYERVIADIFEHIIYVENIFSINLFQRPKS